MLLELDHLIGSANGSLEHLEFCASGAGTLVRSWKVKALLLGLASRAPGGPAIYQCVQDIQAQRCADADDMLERALDLLDLYRVGGREIADRDFLEIGTGWCPWVPLMLRLAGARRVVTLDVNPWLSHQTAVKTTRALLDRSAEIADRLHLDPSHIERTLAPVAMVASLASWLAASGTTYLERTDMTTAAFSSGSFDGVLSSNVLEHVPVGELERIHGESARVLRPGGVIAHRFNPQDHFSFADRSISGANFLQFSEDQWKWLGGSGLAYHNRLRCPQHRRLIEGQGFAIEHCRTRADPAAQLAIDTGRLRVDAAFTGMSSADLTDDYMWVVARKPAGED